MSYDWKRDLMSLDLANYSPSETEFDGCEGERLTAYIEKLEARLGVICGLCVGCENGNQLTCTPQFGHTDIIERLGYERDAYKRMACARCSGVTPCPCVGDAS